MPFTIRPAQYEDAEAIAHVQVESWKTTYAGIVPQAFLDTFDIPQRIPKWHDLLSTPNSPIFVAQDKDPTSTIVGFISGGPTREQSVPPDAPRYDAELYAVYLLESSQRHGLGRTLTQTLAAALNQQGFQSLLVQVLEQNPAVTFYQHLGAVEIARTTIHIGGADLPELTLAWPSLAPLLPSRTEQPNPIA